MIRPVEDLALYRAEMAEWPMTSAVVREINDLAHWLDADVVLPE